MICPSGRLKLTVVAIGRFLPVNAEAPNTSVPRLDGADNSAALPLALRLNATHRSRFAEARRLCSGYGLSPELRLRAGERRRAAAVSDHGLARFAAGYAGRYHLCAQRRRARAGFHNRARRPLTRERTPRLIHEPRADDPVLTVDRGQPQRVADAPEQRILPCSYHSPYSYSVDSSAQCRIASAASDVDHDSRMNRAQRNQIRETIATSANAPDQQ
jgi:hypothetical protein